MAGKIINKFKEPKYAEFSRKDLVIDIKNGILYYKSNLGVHRISSGLATDTFGSGDITNVTNFNVGIPDTFKSDGIRVGDSSITGTLTITGNNIISGNNTITGNIIIGGNASFGDIIPSPGLNVALGSSAITASAGSNQIEGPTSLFLNNDLIKISTGSFTQTVRVGNVLGSVSMSIDTNWLGNTISTGSHDFFVDPDLLVVKASDGKKELVLDRRGNLDVDGNITVDSITADLAIANTPHLVYYNNSTGLFTHQSASLIGEGILSSSGQIADDISGSFTSISASIATDIVAASQTFKSDGIRVGDAQITGSLIVTETITAQEFHTEFISSSIIFQSGSTIFGNTTDDTHKFTGTLSISGSGVGHITASGNISASGTITADTFVGTFKGALSSSAQIANDITGSWQGELSSSVYLQQVSDTISGSWKYNQNLLSSSAQIDDDISGSLGINADLIRSLTAAGISGSYQGEGVLSSSTQIADDISGSWQSQYFNTLSANIISGSWQSQYFSTLSATTITGSWKYNQNLLSSSAQIKNDISGSLGANADLIRTLTAAGISGSYQGEGVLSSSAQIKDDISGSLGANADLIRSLTAEGISGSSPFTATSISGSLGANADLIRSLTATTISGSSPFTATSITGSWKYNQNLLSSSTQIKDDISGSWQSQYFNTLTAAAISGSFQNHVPGLLSSSTQIKDDISGSLGTNADLIRSLTATGISGSSPFTATSITGSWKYNQNLLSSSAQIKNDISGSLGANADLVRSLTAAGISGSYQGEGVLSSSAQIKDDISGSLGANADLIRSLTATTISGSSPFTATSITGSWKYNQNLLSSSAQIKDDISGSWQSQYFNTLSAAIISGSNPFTADSISGSLGTNADLIRSLTAEGISGSSPFTADSISGSLGANADLIRTLTATTISGSSPFTATSITGSWKYNQNLLSSSAQIKDDISGSLGANADLIRSLTATTISGSSPFTATSISGSLGANADLIRSLTATTISGSSPFTATSITGSWKYNQNLLSSSAQIKDDISGSWQGELSSSVYLQQVSDTISGSSPFTADSISGSWLSQDFNTLTAAAISGSFLLNTTDILDGDLTVTGKITAQEFHTEFVSASIIFSSGSTQFGDTSDDIHTFSGSIHVIDAGNITASGNISSSGTIIANEYYADSAPIVDYITGTNTLRFAGGGAKSLFYGDLATLQNISSNGHITASGNISASGDVIADNLYVEGGKIYGNEAYNNFIRFNDSSSLVKIQSKTYIKFDGSSGQKEVTVNEGTNDIDFVVKGASNNPLFKTDSATNQIGMHGVGTPAADLHLGGNLKTNSHITASGNISASGIVSGISGSFPGIKTEHIQTSFPNSGIKIGRVEDDTEYFEIDDTFLMMVGDGTPILKVHKDASAVTIGNNVAVPQNQTFTVGGSISSSGTVTFSGLVNNPSNHILYYDRTIGALTFGDVSGSLNLTGILSSSSQIEDDISGSWQGELSSSVYLQQVSDIISGSWQSQDFTNLSAAGISGSFLLNTTDTLTGDLNVTRHITASDGNISASGDLLGDRLIIDNLTSIETNGGNTGRLFEDGSITAIEVGRGSAPLSKTISLFGPVTASGNISASGEILANSANITGHVLISDTDNDKYFGSNVNLILNADADQNSGASARNIIFQNRGSEVARIDALGNITASANISASGTGSFGDINLPDDGKLHLGDSNDLQIYHDGSNSYIKDKGDGFLFIQGSNSLILESATGENYFKGDADGAVKLYHDNSIKLETAESGINITGNITSSGNILVQGTYDGNITASGIISASGHITASSINLPKLNEVSTTKALFYDVDFGTVSYGTAATNYSAATISGSLGANADLIRTLTTEGISGSLGANADLIRTLTADGISGSWQSQDFANLSAAGISGSFLLNTTDTLDGDLTVTGILTAQEFHTEFVSSSIIYTSGSTQFGNSSDDIHTFTGNISVSGSTAGHITASGDISASGLLFASASDAAGQPYLTVLVDTGSGRFYYTGSYGGGGSGGGEGIGFPYAGSDAITNDPAQAVITGSLFVSGSGHITASGKISSSGIITNNIIAANVFLPGQGKISFDDSLNGTDQFIQGNDNNITVDGDNQINLKADLQVNLDTPIVSSSGTIHIPSGKILDGTAKVALKTLAALKLSGSTGDSGNTSGLGFIKESVADSTTASLANSSFDGSSPFHLRLNLENLEQRVDSGGDPLSIKPRNAIMAFSSGSDPRSNTYRATIAQVGQGLVGFDSGQTFLTYNEGLDAMQVVFPIGMVSGSQTFSSPSQGTLRSVVNGVTTNVDLGLQTTDNVIFNQITASGHISASGNITSSGLFATEKIVISNNKKILGKKTGGNERDLIHINNGNVVVVGNSFEKLRFKSKSGEGIIVDEDIAMGSGRSVDVNFGSFVASGSSELLFRTLTSGTQPKEISINNFGGVGNITASGVISASGHITASSINLPLLNEISTTNTLFYNSNDGTVSYGTAASNFTADSISGSLGANADLIRSLTANGISGSFLLNTTDTLTGNLTVTGDITASNISASSLLFASSSNAAGNPYLTVLVDTGSGRFYYTGSYGGGGGGGSADNLGDHTATQTLDMSGFTISGAKDIFIEERIYHKDDPHTNIKFDNDKISFNAGGTGFLRLNNTTQDEVVINDGGTDIDFRIESANTEDIFFVQGNGAGKVSIGANNGFTNSGAPLNKFQINFHGADGDNGLQFVRIDNQVLGNETLGGIGFDSNNGDVPSSIFEASAYIAGFAAEQHTVNDKGGYLTFGTAPINQDQNTVSSERMRITADGYVGINTTNPGCSLQVSGVIKASTAVSASGIGLGRVDELEGGLGITVDNTTKPYSPKITFNPGGTQNGIITSGDPNGGTDLYTVRTGVTVDLSHNLHVGGDIIAFAVSDKRYKDNITPITNPIKKILQIGGYSFDWNKKQDTYSGHDVGVIAQEIEKVLPEVVDTRENGYKAVRYNKIIPLLIEGIKDQQKQIDELKEMIKKLTK